MKKKSEATEKLSDLVNVCTFNPMRVAVEFSTEHRYLQCELAKMCIHFLHILAINYQKGWYDGRNEWACKTANEIMEKMHDSDNFDPKYWTRYYDEILKEMSNF